MKNSQSATTDGVLEGDGTPTTTRTTTPVPRVGSSTSASGAFHGGASSITSAMSGVVGNLTAFGVNRRNMSNTSSQFLSDREIGGGKLRGDGGDGGQWYEKRTQSKDSIGPRFDLNVSTLFRFSFPVLFHLLLIHPKEF
jgi:hypothetical protein